MTSFPSRVRNVSSVVDVLPGMVVGVSTSLKGVVEPARRSASRGLLGHVLDRLSAAYDRVGLLDLRDHPVPLFDGRFAADREDPHLDRLASCFAAADGLLLSVPAYWSGVSGVSKNLIDLLCGPTYDLPQPATTVFTGKRVAAFVVGADDESARHGAGDISRVMTAVGAHLVAPTLPIGNLRQAGDAEEALERLVGLAAALARAVMHRRAGRP